MTKKCSSCDNLIDDAAAFCDICGAPFPSGARGSQPAAAALVCDGCGAQYLPGEVFCGSCGMQLPPVTSQLLVDVDSPESLPAYVLVDAGTTAGTGDVRGRFVVSGSNTVLVFPGGKPELLIGRAEPDSQIFPDIDTAPVGGGVAGVSRRHAKLTTAAGRVYIEDLGSTNFTFVNRQRLQMGRKVLLNSGDEVRFGRLVMIYDA